MQPHALSRESGDRESEGGKRREQTQATATHETLRVGGRVPAVNATPAFSREKPRSAELACVRSGWFRGAHGRCLTPTANHQHDRAHEVALDAGRPRRRIGFAAGCGPQEDYCPNTGKNGVCPIVGDDRRIIQMDAGDMTSVSFRSASGRESRRELLGYLRAATEARPQSAPRVMKRFKAVVIGGSGYGGAEMIRRLLIHPDVELVRVVAVDHVGEPLGAVHPPLTGRSDLRFENLPPAEAARGADVALLGLPHKVSAQHAPDILKTGDARRRHVGRLPAARRGGVRAVLRRQAPAPRGAGDVRLRPARAESRRDPEGARRGVARLLRDDDRAGAVAAGARGQAVRASFRWSG